MAQCFVSVASSWGLTVKTKGMRISNESSFVDGVPVNRDGEGASVLG